jgi:hypothetical protein
VDTILDTSQSVQITNKTTLFLQSPQLAGVDLADAPTCGRSEKRYCYIFEILTLDQLTGQYGMLEENQERVAGGWEVVTVTQTVPWLQVSADMAISGHMFIKNPELDQELLINEYIGNRNGMIAINGILFLAAVIDVPKRHYRITRPVTNHWQARLMKHFQASLLSLAVKP